MDAYRSVYTLRVMARYNTYVDTVPPASFVLYVHAYSIPWVGALILKVKALVPACPLHKRTSPSGPTRNTHKRWRQVIVLKAMGRQVHTVTLACVVIVRTG